LDSLGLPTNSLKLTPREFDHIKEKKREPPFSAVRRAVGLSASHAIYFLVEQKDKWTFVVKDIGTTMRGVGAEADIVTKEMYTFEDRDGSSLTMRPENTAGVMRTVSPGLRSKCEIPSVSGDHDSELPHVTAEPRSDHCRPSADYEGMVGKAEG
jgi:hypothetical protein